MAIRYESTTAMNQVHLMRRLIDVGLADAKSVAEHISTFNGLLYSTSRCRIANLRQQNEGNLLTHDVV